MAKLATTISKKEKLSKSPQKVTKLAEAKAPRDVRRAQAKFGTHLGREMPKAEDIVAVRRQLDTASKKEKEEMNFKTAAIYRPGNKFLVSQSQERKKPVAAPMMKKSLKMFQNAMRRK